jgi:P27 family predicted phage terminase small subunit
MAGTKGKSGRKQKPTLLKLVTGNPGRRPMNAGEPEPVAAEVNPPDWLDEEAKQKWAEVLKLCPWITAADCDTLALYCDAFSHYRKAQRLSIRTPVVKTPEAKISKNPAWTARNEAFQQLRSAGSELGLSPSSRSGIFTGERKVSDPAEKYFAS